MTPFEKLILTNLMRGLEYANDNIISLELLRIKNIIFILITEIRKTINDKQNGNNE